MQVQTRPSGSQTAYFRDLRDYLETLDQRGKLIRVSEPINKDTDIHPLMRLQFRGLPPSERKGWYFENVFDNRGRRFDIPVVTGVMAASREIYAIGMQCRVEEILDRWGEALAHPIPPVMVDSGPCQEVVLQGEELLRAGGLDLIPVPISTPGFDNAPYTTASHFVSRNPVTGVRNIGNYRGMLKAPDRLGCLTGTFQDMGRQWLKAREVGLERMDVAVIIGSTPNIAYTATAKVPSEIEEYAVAGAMAGAPVELVQCKTIDMQVPANAEIIIEGWVPTNYLEVEGPFGEFTGFMARSAPANYLNVTAITMRRNPLYLGFISQFPPSESTVLRSIGREAAVKRFLSVDHGLAGVVDVVQPEALGVWPMCVIRVDQREGAKPGEVIAALKSADRLLAKIVVVVDYDIDPNDFVNLLWAISYRMQPERDTQYATMIPNNLDYSYFPPDNRAGIVEEAGLEGKALIIDATIKWPYPPVSLPSEGFMRSALERWQRMGLPELKLTKPWYGYSLGEWSEEDESDARLALEGRHFETGAKFAAGRVRADGTPA